MSIENKIKLLWEGAISLQKEQQIHKLLKSYYINTCRKLAKANLQVPKEKFAISQMCPHCGSFWNSSDYGLKLTRKKIKNTSKVKRLIEKLEQADDTRCKVLNKNQRNRAKWLKKRVLNYMAIKCFQCQHSSLLKLENPKCKFNLKDKREEETCGISSGYIKDQQKLKVGNFNNKTTESKISTSTPSKSKKGKHKEKLKTSRLQNAEKYKNTALEKVISNTRKQNSLLQLAALLQKQSKADLSNNTQKRLQSFLK